MFERYTEKARRAIFFARYEASQYGSTTIETEHLLLGIIREDHALTRRFLSQKGGAQALRDEIESHITRGARISTSVEVPLSPRVQAHLEQWLRRRRSVSGANTLARTICYSEFSTNKAVSPLAF